MVIFFERFLLFCMDMKEIDSVPWTKHRNKPFCVIHHTTGQQHQCIQTQIVALKQTTAQQQRSSNELVASHSPTSHKTHSSIIPMLLVAFLLVVSLVSPALSDSGHSLPANQTFHPASQLNKLKRVTDYLTKINKPAVKTFQAHKFCVFHVVSLCINQYKLLCFMVLWSGFLFILLQSPDGDVIDCVPSHLQPAFDHPELKGQKPLVISKFSFSFSIKIIDTQTRKEIPLSLVFECL